jgi:hypothetical protein
MSSSWDKLAIQGLTVFGIPVFSAGAGALAGWLAGKAYDRFYHDTKWAYPVVGAAGGLVGGIIVARKVYPMI